MLTLLAVFKTRQTPPRPLLSTSVPKGIMGTTCQLAVVTPQHSPEIGSAALAAAEREIRRIEALMSTYLTESELSRLNRAPADSLIVLSPRLKSVVAISRSAHHFTDGAFDITCQPQILLWQQCAKKGRIPSAEEIIRARQLSNWHHFALSDSGILKKAASASLNLGGVAKGYAIDRAVAVMQRNRAAGGLVDIGGDVFGFGPSAHGEYWKVDIRHPWREGEWGTLKIRDRAVCTSGNYARYVEIDGRRYSHIINPRTGQPMDTVPSVTVIAPTAALADIWATALSVWGPEGLEKIPPEHEVAAMLVTIRAEIWQIYMTRNFPAYLTTDSELFNREIIYEP